MKTPALVVLALACAALALPAAAAVDPCQAYGVCLPSAGWFVDGCHVNALVVRGDVPTEGCAPTATAYSCDVDYFGGSGSFLGNFRFQCQPVLTLP